MPKVADAHLTEQQKKWFASVRGGLERETGRSLAEWVAVARACPETKHRARLAWFKSVHGLLQNRASYVISEAFPLEAGWSEPDALRQALWTDPIARAILEAVEAKLLAFPGVIVGQRKGYSAFSRKHQFAAMRPAKGGVRLGLAVAPDAAARLEPAARSEGWSERLRSTVALSTPGEADAELEALLRMAFEAS